MNMDWLTNTLLLALWGDTWAQALLIVMAAVLWFTVRALRPRDSRLDRSVHSNEDINQRFN